MAEEVLSQNEVDALLSAIEQDEDVSISEPTQDQSKSEINTYKYTIIYFIAK